MRNNISFLGDIMLGRFVQEKYNSQKYELVSPEIRKIIGDSDFVVANLESPITSEESQNSLAFAGDASMLSEFKWIDMFSLSNNHINDFGDIGITDTIRNLEEAGFRHNGIYKDVYKPFLIEDEGNKVAIVTCTDMLNYELTESSQYKLLRADSPEVNKTIREYSDRGYLVILFSHCGSLFSRFANPSIRKLLHSAIDCGANCVITCHSHCLGGVEIYKGVPIIYSLGDFLMDGGSYRRRKACILSLQINNNALSDWIITPTITNNDLQVLLPVPKESKTILKGFENVSKKMQKEYRSYENFYKYQYKKEMIAHSLSTLHFLYNTKGVWGFLRMLKVRWYAVYRMVHRMIFDRSKMRYDADGIAPKHLLNNSDIR